MWIYDIQCVRIGHAYSKYWGDLCEYNIQCVRIGHAYSKYWGDVCEYMIFNVLG